MNMNPANEMKTALISLAAAAVMAAACFASGRAFDAADFTAIAFVTALVAWTVVQYREIPSLVAARRPVRLPVRLPSAPVLRRNRLAA